MAKIEKYDPKSRCPRCGSKDARTVTVPAQEMRTARDHGDGLFETWIVVPFHFQRPCTFCGHTRLEAPLDAPKVK